MRLQTLFSALMCLASVTRASTLHDADTAVLSGDTTRALAILEELTEHYPKNSSEYGECALRKARILVSRNNADAAADLLKKTLAIPGLPEATLRKVGAERIRVLDSYDRRGAREAAKHWLASHTHGADAAGIRLLLAKRLAADGDTARAVDLLHDRPADERNQPFDSPLAEAEQRLKLVLAAQSRPRDPEPSHAALKEAEALTTKDPRKALLLLARLRDDASTSKEARFRATLLRVRCLDEVDNLTALTDEALRLAAMPPDGVSAATLAEGRLLAADMLLNADHETLRALAAARDALAFAAPGSETAESARWVAALALVRLKSPQEDIWEMLKDSPAVLKSPYPKSSPTHPVNRLLAAEGSIDRWIESNLHQAAPAAATPSLRSADECFIARRYEEAAKRYAKAETRGSPSLDARAYAVLQRARALALTPRASEAIPVYRRFLTDKALAKSAYAPGALLRAGTLCEGRLRDTRQAREFFKSGYELYPETADGQACLIYRAESFADGGDRKTAESLYKDYLKKHPEGHHASAAKKFLNDLRSTKK